MRDEYDDDMVEDVESASLIPHLVTSIPVFLLGLFMLFINIMSLIHNMTYIETTAKVVDTRYDSDSNCYVPIYEYTFNNEKVTADGIECYDSSETVIGSEKTINYNPKNYRQFDIGSRKESWILWLICGFCLFVSGSALYKFIKLIRGLRVINSE